jgi:two-component system LytT family response regulator
MQKLRALIVDDEPKAVELLRQLVSDTGRFDQIVTATSVAESGMILKSFTPDLVFLDIRMPDRDGFGLLEILRNHAQEADVVFVTAYEQYTLKALKHHAFDYLLKPVDRKELMDCIDAYQERRRHPDVVDRLEQLLQDNERPKLRISTRSGHLFIDQRNILYCKADGNYTLIDLGDKQHLCSLQLGAIEDQLAKRNGFHRLGRSLIIHLSLISGVDRKAGTVTFQRGSDTFSLTLTKAQLKEFENLPG